MATLATPDCAARTVIRLMVRIVAYNCNVGNCDGVCAIVRSELNPLR